MRNLLIWRRQSDRSHAPAGRTAKRAETPLQAKAATRPLLSLPCLSRSGIQTMSATSALPPRQITRSFQPPSMNTPRASMARMTHHVSTLAVAGSYRLQAEGDVSHREVGTHPVPGCLDDVWTKIIKPDPGQPDAMASLNTTHSEANLPAQVCWEPCRPAQAFIAHYGSASVSATASTSRLMRR